MLVKRSSRHGIVEYEDPNVLTVEETSARVVLEKQKEQTKKAETESFVAWAASLADGSEKRVDPELLGRVLLALLSRP